MSPPKPSAPFTTPSLEHLAGLVGEPDEQLRNALFRRTSEETLVEYGTRVDSKDILEDVVSFTAISLEILKKLTAQQRSLIKLPPGLFALLLDEARVLRRLKMDHDAMLAAMAGGTRSEREAALRQSMREGLALRNVTYKALRNVLGHDGINEVDEVIGVGDTASKLAMGLEGLTSLLHKKLQGDPMDRYLFSEFGLDESYAAELSHCAARIRKLDEAPPPPDRVVTQRMLDLQDGRVLHLIAMILRAFRAAHKADTAVSEPELNSIGWLFGTQSTRHPS